jgi:hypothetical protein
MSRLLCCCFLVDSKTVEKRDKKKREKRKMEVDHLPIEGEGAALDIEDKVLPVGFGVNQSIFSRMTIFIRIEMTLKLSLLLWFEIHPNGQIF